VPAKPSLLGMEVNLKDMPSVCANFALCARNVRDMWAMAVENPRWIITNVLSGVVLPYAVPAFGLAYAASGAVGWFLAVALLAWDR